MTRYPKFTPRFQWRFWCIVLLFIIGLVGLIWRLIDLTVYERQFLQHQGDVRTIRTIATPAYRGMITDRYGEPLAVTTPVSAIWVNPKQFILNPANVNVLADILSLPKDELYKRIDDNKTREFLYIKRQVNPDLAQQIMTLKLPGVSIQSELRRYYPSGEVSGQLIGFTNIDDIGQEGLELAYNDWLQGIPGERRVLKDRLGRVVEELNLVRAAKPGNDLTLSLDRRIQYLAYRALKSGVEKFDAVSASAIVIDVKTGEVLAMVNQPSFNPNNRSGVVDSYRNRAITDTFEPGSTMKTFSVAAALAYGHYQPDTLVDTRPGWMMIGRNKVEDLHNDGIIDVTTVLQRSSNVGVSKLILSLPEHTLPQFLRKLGFGQSTNIGFPGEENGFLPQYKKWKPFVLATLSFGYAMSATNLQLAQAYMVIANRGLKCPLTLLRVAQRPNCERVMDADIANKMINMLEVVVEKGAVHAQVPSYRVAGKTGTVRLIGANGRYEKNRHLASFVGMAPASDPRLVVAVVIREPRGRLYYGSLTAAPVFSEIMTGALRFMDAYPDKLAPLPPMDALPQQEAQ